MMKDHCSRVAKDTAVEVLDCPRNKDQFEKRKRLKQCEKLSTRCRQATYHCVVNPFMNATIETCAPEAYIFDSKCAELNKGERPIQGSSHQKAKCKKCPKNHYPSTESFKYPECYDAVQRKNIGGNVIVGTGFNYMYLIPISIGAVVVIVIVIAIIIWLRRRQANTSGEDEEGRLATSEQNQAGQQNHNDQTFEMQNLTPIDNNAEETDPLGESEGIQNGHSVSLEVRQPENSVQTNRECSEQRYGNVAHDDENAGVSETDDDDEENSERKPLLRVVTTADQKAKPQFRITRRRYVSESDAYSFKSYFKETDEGTHVLDNEMNAASMTKGKGQTIRSEETNKERKKAIVLKLLSSNPYIQPEERRRTRSETDAENVEAHVKNLKNFP